MDSPARAQGAVTAIAHERLFQPGRNCYKLARADRVALLVDAEAYFKAFVRAAEKARSSILIVGWDFNSRTRLLFGDDNPGVPPILGDFLNFVAARRRVHVYILDWDFPVVFGTDRELTPIYGAGWKRHRRVHLCYDNTHPTTGSHHQKIAVIDDAIAFSGGLDLTLRRWDTCEHIADDPRRMVENKSYPPFHDVMIAIDGDAARAVAEVARQRWRDATGVSLPAAGTGSDPWPDALRPAFTNVDIAVSRSAPPRAGAPEVREIEALYLDMIRQARRYIYFENQYFTSYKVGEALAERLQEPDGPEIVLVTRMRDEGWLAEATMQVLRARLVRTLRSADRHGRFGAYYPHLPGLPETFCLKIHSKVTIADDEWLRVGSANLCNRSMGMDTECDLSLEARGSPAVMRAVADFRNQLLAEQFAVPASRLDKEIRCRGSIIAAIDALRTEGRSLRPLPDEPESPDAVLSLAQITDPERPAEMDRLIAQFAPEDYEREAGFAWGKVAAIAIVCVGLVAMWRYTPLAALVRPEQIIAWGEEFAGRVWAPFALIAAYTVASFTLFPRPLLTLCAVVAFGAWLGAAFAMLGILLAAAVNYAVGRRMGRSAVRRIAGDRINRVSQVLRNRGLLAMTMVRLVPIAPFAVIGIVAGAIRLRFVHLMGGTALGMLPGAVVTVFFGDQLQSALRDPARINYGLIFTVLAIFAVGTLAVRRWLVKSHVPG